MRGDDQAAEQAGRFFGRNGSPCRRAPNITVAFAQFGRVVAGLGSGGYTDRVTLRSVSSIPRTRPITGDLLLDDRGPGRGGASSRPRRRGGKAWSRSKRRRAADSATGLRSASTKTTPHGRRLRGGGAVPGGAVCRFRPLPVPAHELCSPTANGCDGGDGSPSPGIPCGPARDAFDALACGSWGDEARRELRASGESSRRRVADRPRPLTAQNFQIAELAAEGLSNRDIGQKLFVSPRTVSTHLYRIYPELGISGRAELASALEATL